MTVGIELIYAAIYFILIYHLRHNHISLDRLLARRTLTFSRDCRNAVWKAWADSPLPNGPGRGCWRPGVNSGRRMLPSGGGATRRRASPLSLCGCTWPSGPCPGQKTDFRAASSHPLLPRERKIKEASFYAGSSNRWNQDGRGCLRSRELWAAAGERGGATQRRAGPTLTGVVDRALVARHLWMATLGRAFIGRRSLREPLALTGILSLATVAHSFARALAFAAIGADALYVGMGRAAGRALREHRGGQKHRADSCSQNRTR